MSFRALTIAAIAALSLSAQQPVWNTDFDSAKLQASRENKPLLLDFTGPGWCPYCVLLDEEVLKTAEFARFARDFVLVKVEFPPQKERTEARIKADPTLAKAMELKGHYKVSGFPMLLILSASGDEQARHSGYRKGMGPAVYLAALAKDRKR